MDGEASPGVYLQDMPGAEETVVEVLDDRVDPAGNVDQGENESFGTRSEGN